MKYGKICVLLISMFSILLMLVSCSADKELGSAGMEGGGVHAGGDMNSTASPEPDTEKEEGAEAEAVLLPAGQMTAAAWNDNDNYDAWKALFAQGEEKNGKFFGYYGERSWAFTSQNRVKVTVKHNDTSVKGAKILARSADGRALFQAVTDALGNAYIFTDEDEGSVIVTVGDCEVSGKFSKDDRDITLSVDKNTEKKNIIEIMFVIDVTGSMGDELKYVESEVSDVIARVAKENPEAIINMALLFYRDHTDNEEFAYHDFVNVIDQEGLSSVISNLRNQSAEGGGDYPEAVDEALAIAVSKQWSSAAATKLIFHILDAPPHDKETNKSTYKAAVDTAAEKGIRICPILCSGADVLTEYLTRQAAIYTGGTFIFVTDDSGIGGEHHDPDLPNVTVELLNSLLVRIIDGYHTGEFSEPVDWRQEVK